MTTRPSNRKRRARSTEYAYGSMSGLSPYPIRRELITYHLRTDTPERVVRGRMDVGMELLDGHYDQWMEKNQVEQR